MKRSFFLSLAVLLCALLPFVGCTDGATAKPSYTPIPRTDEYKIAITEFPVTLDPHYWEGANGAITYQIYDGLLEAYLGNPFDLRPCIATGYEISDNNLTYTFTLREGVKFHNGDPVTVDDVIYSLERWKASPVNAADAEIIKTVEKGPKPNTVSVTCTAVSPSIIQIVGLIGIVNKDVMSTFDPAVDNADTVERVVGTGAYKLTEIEIGRRIVLELYEDYHMFDISMNGHKSDIKKVIITLISDPTAAMLAFNQGEINYVTSGNQATMEDIDEARKKEQEAYDLGLSPPVRVTSVETAYRYILAFNMNDPVVGAQNGTDEQKERARKIRQAIAHSIERDVLNQVMFNGLSSPITQLTNPMTEGYDNSIKNPDEDHEKAKEILRSLGYATSVEEETETKLRLRLDLTYVTETWATKFATAIQDQLTKSGIVVNMLGFEANTWFQRVYPSKQYQVTCNAYAPVVPNPDRSFRSPYFSTSYWNPFGYVNPEVDKLIDDARYEMDTQERIKLLTRVNQIVTVEDMIYIPCLASKITVLNNTYFFGFYPEPTYCYAKYYRMFWDDDGIWTEENGFPYLDGSMGYSPSPGV